MREGRAALPGRVVGAGDAGFAEVRADGQGSDGRTFDWRVAPRGQDREGALRTVIWDVRWKEPAARA